MANLCDDDVNCMTIEPITIKPEYAHDSGSLRFSTIQEEHRATANSESLLFNSPVEYFYDNNFCDNNHIDESEEIGHTDFSTDMPVKEEFLHSDNNRGVGVTTAEIDISKFTKNMKQFTSCESFVNGQQSDGCDRLVRLELSTNSDPCDSIEDGRTMTYETISDKLHVHSNKSIKSEPTDVSIMKSGPSYTQITQSDANNKNTYGGSSTCLTNTCGDTCIDNSEIDLPSPDILRIKNEYIDIGDQLANTIKEDMSHVEKLQVNSQFNFFPEYLLPNGGEATHLCNICDKRFPCSSDHKISDYLPTTDEAHSCLQFCRNVSHSNCQSHDRTTVTVENSYSCDTCDMKFARFDHLERHIITHFTEKAHTCTHCNKGFTKASQLKRHIMTHTGEKPHICPQCNMNFSRPDNLKKHLATHSGEKPHTCPHCNKSFSQAGHMMTHMMTHSGEKPHRCPQCNMNFSRPYNLKIHVALHSGEKPHTCTQCNKRYTQAKHLKRHIMTHSGEKPHRCPQCNKSFVQASTMKRHMMMHSQENPHACLKCNESFTKAKSLRTHMMIHNGKQIHICSLCKMIFARPDGLKRHMASHSGKKPHTCLQCSKSFTQASSLRMHMMIHNGKKLHICPLCNMSFIEIRSMKRHMLIHSGEKPHRCLQCNNSFALAIDLKTHCSSQHAIP